MVGPAPARASGRWWATPSGVGWPARRPGASTKVVRGPRPPGARSWTRPAPRGRGRRSRATSTSGSGSTTVRDEASSAVARGRTRRAAPAVDAASRPRRAGRGDPPRAGRRRWARPGRPRLEQRLGDASRAFQAERYTDAARIVRKLTEEAPERGRGPRALRPDPLPPGQVAPGHQAARGLPAADRLDRAAPGAGRLLPGRGPGRHGRRAVGRAAPGLAQRRAGGRGPHRGGRHAGRPGRPARRHPAAGGRLATSRAAPRSTTSGGATPWPTSTSGPATWPGPASCSGGSSRWLRTSPTCASGVAPWADRADGPRHPGLA